MEYRRKVGRIGSFPCWLVLCCLSCTYYMGTGRYMIVWFIFDLLEHYCCVWFNLYIWWLLRFCFSQSCQLRKTKSIETKVLYFAVSLLLGDPSSSGSTSFITGDGIFHYGIALGRIRPTFPLPTPSPTVHQQDSSSTSEVRKTNQQGKQLAFFDSARDS